jgi:hypothetical protein
METPHEVLRVYGADASQPNDDSTKFAYMTRVNGVFSTSGIVLEDFLVWHKSNPPYLCCVRGLPPLSSEGLLALFHWLPRGFHRRRSI